MCACGKKKKYAVTSVNPGAGIPDYVPEEWSADQAQRSAKAAIANAGEKAKR